jgi:multiple sugar transport system permease protein
MGSSRSSAIALVTPGHPRAVIAADRARAGAFDRLTILFWSGIARTRVDDIVATCRLSNPNIVLFSVAIPDIWLTTSFMTLVLFAGLQNLPPDVLEAARVDGVGGWALLTRIILPLLLPVIAVALIVRGVDAAKAFDVILIQTNGGPEQASTTLSLLIYQTMVRFNEVGLASAMSVIYLVVMLAVATVAIVTLWRPGKAD